MVWNYKSIKAGTPENSQTCEDYKTHSCTTNRLKNKSNEKWKKFLETSEGNTIYQNVWDTAKIVVDEITVISAYIKKKKWSRINNLTLYLNELVKEQKQQAQS